ncbi:MAG: RNA-binding protein [Holosporaceae bacterium]|jgi:RNA recognition motif-containing protein|nr:RNA-binding protein [Holosporaceae bacterium]
MTKKLYIGNLAYSVNDDSLKDAFSQFGEVESAVIVKDKVSGRSKGFGFVEMSTDESAAAAIAKMNKTEFAGRLMFVSESHSTDGPRRSSGGPGGNGGNGGGARRFGGGEHRSDRRPVRR